MKRHARLREKPLYRWITPLFDPVQLIRTFPQYPSFFKDLITYSKLPYSERLEIPDIYPCLNDKTQITSFDAHYFYQDIWAFKKIYKYKTEQHVDVGSRVIFVGLLTVITQVTFIDIRPLMADLDNFDSRKGNILSLPFQDNSVSSLSCLHVAEHVGLGRYGDPLDPLGTKKACKELSRVLAVGGNLYFSLPIGKPKLCFNAHRIHSSEQIIDYLSDLELVDFSCVDDEGHFQENIDIHALENSDYACGLFHFTKK